VRGPNKDKKIFSGQIINNINIFLPMYPVVNNANTEAAELSDILVNLKKSDYCNRTTLGTNLIQ
jgi:hypothetical protein